MEIPQNYYMMLHHQQGNNGNKSMKYKYKENIENYAPGNNVYYFRPGNNNGGKKQQAKNINNNTDPENNPPFSRLFVTCGKEMEEEELNSIFEEYGEMSSCKLLKDKLSSESKGIAFVKYNKASSAAKAIECLDNKVLEGQAQPIKVQIADMKGTNNKVKKKVYSKEPEDTPARSRLFVVCPKEMTEETLTNKFRGISEELEYCKVITNKLTNESKGFAYAKFYSASSAANAMETIQETGEIDGMKVKVLIADPKVKKSNEGMNGFYNPHFPHFDMLNVTSASPQTFGVQPGAGAVYPMNGIPMFTQSYGHHQYPYSNSAGGMPQQSPPQQIPGGGSLLSQDNKRTQGLHHPHQTFNAGAGAGQSSYIFHPSYPGGSTQPVSIPAGSQQQAIHQMAMPPQQQFSQSTLFIQVHTSITQEQLMELFSAYPSLEYCDLKLDHHTGESQGIAYINFSNPSYAALAKDDLDGYEYPKGYPLKILFAATENSSLSIPPISVINSPPQHQMHQQFIQSPAAYHLTQSPTSPQGYHYNYPSNNYPDQYIYTPAANSGPHYVHSQNPANANGYIQYFGSPPQLSTSPSHRNDLFVNQQHQYYQFPQQHPHPQQSVHNFIDTRTILFSLPNPMSEKEIRMILSRFGNIDLIKFNNDNPLQGEITFNHPMSGYNAVYYNSLSFEKSIFLSLVYPSNNNNNVTPGNPQIDDSDDSQVFQIDDLQPVTPGNPLIDDQNEDQHTFTPGEDQEEDEDDEDEDEDDSNPQ